MPGARPDASLEWTHCGLPPWRTGQREGSRLVRAAAGYSGTPLAKKLGITAGSRVVLENPPENYFELLAPIPPGVLFEARVSLNTDIVHVFAESCATFVSALHRMRERIRSDAAVWVSWPKKASKVPTDITEDRIREAALPLGLVDVKVCAVSEVWSGLKLVIRKELRP
jgi:hypothetical protein